MARKSKKITELTAEQTARFPEFVEKWTAIGLSTEPANRPEAEAGIREAYQIAGLEPPKRIVWCGSPMSQALTRAVLVAAKDYVRAPVYDAVVESVVATVRKGVHESTLPQFAWDAVRSDVLRVLSNAVYASVGNCVRDALRRDVFREASGTVLGPVRDAVSESVWEFVQTQVAQFVWEDVVESVGDVVRDAVRDTERTLAGLSVSDEMPAWTWEHVHQEMSEPVWHAVGESVTDAAFQAMQQSVGESVRGSVREAARASVASAVAGDVEAWTWEHVWQSVAAPVRESISSPMRNAVVQSASDFLQAVSTSVRESVSQSGYGQHDANWVGFFDFFRTVCGLTEQTQRLSGITKIVQNAGWWLPHKNVCFVCERHNILRRDDRGRLHCETGPAVAYPDGLSIYAINGVVCDEQIIMRPESQTIEQIRGDDNEERKRIRIERYGWPRYLQDVGAERIDTRRNDIEGTREALYKTDIANVLVCACPSTAKVFALEVSPESKTCEEAQSYLSSGLNSRIISAS